MKQLREVKGETEQYKPFCSLANLIQDEAQKAFPPPTSAIPFRFACHDPKSVQGVADFLANPSKSTRWQIKWVNILAAVEFKMGPRKPAETKMASTQTKSPSGALLSLASQPISASVEPPKRKAPSFEPDKEPLKKKSRTGRSVRTNSSGIPKDTFNQLSSYALEMLSSTEGTRQHALGIFFDGMELQLWYYDRAGAIHSDGGVDFPDNFVSFATIVMALGRLSPTQFGVLSYVNFPSKSILLTSLKNATITILDIHHQEHKVTMSDEVISCRPGIVGRSRLCVARSATHWATNWR